MKCLKLFFGLIFFSSCSSTKSIVGLYGKCDNEYLACSQIHLKPDNSFEYFIFMDVGGGTIIKGNWETMTDDSVKLNTFEQPVNSRTTYKAQVNPQRTSIKIKLSDFETPLGGAIITLNNQHEEMTLDQNGVIEIKPQKIKTITYHYLGQREIISIENPDYNDIEITVRDLDINPVPRFLTDKIITIGNGELFFKDGHSLKKTILKNKQWK